MTINAHTQLYAVFGHPVRHSLSPVMHNAAFRESGIDAVYLAFEPDSIRGAVESMKSMAIPGASITIPFKIDILPFLDDIDRHAADIGSVNTLHNLNGRIIGHNTDGRGAVRALVESGISIEGASCLIIGNGGSARSIGFSLVSHRASVLVAGRNPGRARSLASDLGGDASGVRAIGIPEIDPAIMEGVDIVINTTPVGMAADARNISIAPDLISPRHAVFDIVYVPRTTRLLSEASKRRAHTIHGIDMLVYQGALQFELWTGQEAPVEAMFRAVNEALREPR
jgi:shikimate dehydrogenase